jgi:hypothetical protein
MQSKGDERTKRKTERIEPDDAALPYLAIFTKLERSFSASTDSKSERGQTRFPPSFL